MLCVVQVVKESYIFNLVMRNPISTRLGAWEGIRGRNERERERWLKARIFLERFEQHYVNTYNLHELFKLFAQAPLAQAGKLGSEKSQKSKSI